MDTKRIKKRISDMIGLRLPVKKQTLPEPAESVYSSLRRDSDIQFNQGIILKRIYKDVKAPDSFSSCVMLRIRKEKLKALPLRFSLRLTRDLRPVAAVAACFVLIAGLYFGGAFLPAVPFEDERETVQTPVEGVDPLDIQTAEKHPYVNGDGPILSADTQEEPADVPAPATEVQPAVNTLLAQNGQVDDLSDDAVTLEAPVIGSSDQVRLVTVSQDNDNADAEEPALPDSFSANGYSRAEAVSKPLEIAPLANENAAFVLSEADIPDTSLFMPRKRVIDSVSVSITVGTINNALRKLEEREQLFEVFADNEATEIRTDGTIVVMRSYVVPKSLESSFIAQVSALGEAAKIKRDSIDITQDYNLMLASHRDYIADLAATGQGVRKINDIVAELVFFDKRANEGVRNVVVWLEDAVDF